MSINSLTNQIQEVVVQANTTSDGSISLIEKIMRLPDLMDPWLAPINALPYYADNLGYNVGLNRSDISNFSTSATNEHENLVEANKYLRFMTSSLSEWYRTKTNTFSVKTMLYSFGLVGDLVYYYANEYADDKIEENTNSTSEYAYDFEHVSNVKELYTLSCKLINSSKTDKEINEVLYKHSNWMTTNWNPDSMSPDSSDIPDNFFPTPHFMLWFDIVDSIDKGTLSLDTQRIQRIKEAINAIRPINTVFEGINGYFAAGLLTMVVRPYVRTRKILVLPTSDVYADSWKK